MTHRQIVLLALTGLVVLGAALRAAVALCRRRPRPLAATPRYTGDGPQPVNVYTPALALGALAALGAGEVLDAVAYRRPRGVIKRELRLASAPYGRSVLGEEDIETAVGRCVNDLLGPGAETVGGRLVAVEEVIRHRNRGGPELWPHAIDEWAARAGLDPAAVEVLHDTAAWILVAEEEMRLAGLLREDDYVPTLLAVHWGQGVHLARGAMRAGWLDRTRGLNYLRRAGELSQRWYPTPRTVLAAQLLPAYLGMDVSWGSRAAWEPWAGQLLADPRSPLLASRPRR